MAKVTRPDSAGAGASRGEADTAIAFAGELPRRRPSLDWFAIVDVFCREGWQCPLCAAEVHGIGDLDDDSWRMGLGGIPEHLCPDTQNNLRCGFADYAPAVHLNTRNLLRLLRLLLARRRAARLRRRLKQSATS